MHLGVLLRLSVRAGRWSTASVCSSVLWLAVVGPAPAQVAAKAPVAPALTQDECIAIALRAQPAIHIQEAAMGAATELRRQARSAFLPQANLSTRYTALDKPLFEVLTNPLAGPLGQVLSDSAAYFGIARQAGVSAANAALSQPNLPPFSSAKQAALSQLPATLSVEIFGTSLLYNQALVTQPLFTGGKIIYRNQQADLGVQAAGADLVKSKQETAFGVARAYQGILLARDLIRAVDGTEGQFRAVEKLAQSLLDGGDEFVTTADVNRARALRLLASDQRIEFERALDLAQAALRQAMGVPLDDPLTIADDRLHLKMVTLDEATVLAQAMARRPELLKADLGVRNSQLEEKIAKAQLYPNVGLFGSFSTLTGKRSFPNPGDDSEWQVGVAGEIPLFAGGRNLAGIRQARHKIQQSLETQRLARELITLEVKQVYLQYKEMSDRLSLAEAAAKEARSALKSYNDQYSGKLIANKDVPKYFENISTGRLLLFTAEARYNQHMYTYNLALAKIRLVTAADE